MKIIFSALILSIYFNTSFAQNVFLFYSNGEELNANDLQNIVNGLVQKTGRTNLYYSIDGFKKNKIKFTKRNQNNIPSVAGKLKSTYTNSTYISGSDIQREIASQDGLDYLCFIQHPHRYIDNNRLYKGNIKNISEIVSKISKSNKRELKKLNIFLFYNSSRPTLTVDNITEKTKFIYNRFISGTITSGNPDLDKFRVYIKFNNEAPVLAEVKANGTWSTQLKLLKSNTKIERLQVFGYPQNHKTDTTDIQEYTNITYSDNPQIVITDPSQQVVSRCKSYKNNSYSTTYRIAFKAYDIDNTKLQLKLDFDPNVFYNRDNSERYHLVKSKSWTVPWTGDKEESDNGETLYCFYLDFGVDIQTKIIECKDPLYKSDGENPHDCTLDFEITGVFQYEIENGKFMNLGAPKVFSFDTFVQDPILLLPCFCGSRQ